MKQFLLFNEQGSCYKCLCELFNIFWCFRFENWYDNSVSINSIFIDKIDNYRLLTPNSFIDFYRISKEINRFLSIVIECYRLSMLSNDYPRFCWNSSTLPTDLFIFVTYALPQKFSPYHISTHVCKFAKLENYTTWAGNFTEIFSSEIFIETSNKFAIRGKKPFLFQLRAWKRNTQSQSICN